eukprot:1150579-Pelagomonas_calceolata.AAC.2
MHTHSAGSTDCELWCTSTICCLQSLPGNNLADQPHPSAPTQPSLTQLLLDPKVGGSSAPHLRVPPPPSPAPAPANDTSLPGISTAPLPLDVASLPGLLHAALAPESQQHQLQQLRDLLKGQRGDAPRAPVDSLLGTGAPAPAETSGPGAPVPLDSQHHLTTGLTPLAGSHFSGQHVGLAGAGAPSGQPLLSSQPLLASHPLLTSHQLASCAPGQQGGGAASSAPMPMNSRVLSVLDALEQSSATPEGMAASLLKDLQAGRQPANQRTSNC